MAKSKLPINTLVVIPEEVFPLDETVNIAYVVCYFVGTSLRGQRYFSNYLAAAEYAETLDHDSFILKLKIDLQKITNFYAG